MSSEAPDPRAFKTWEDAFQHPIPVVRKLEQQLRANANDNRERLRSLVGASYRHLLGTAGRIIDMDADMQQVEVTLGDMGKKCNSRAVDKLCANYLTFERNRREQFKEHHALVAQLAVLQSCPAIVSRLIKKGDSSLLAAKVLVISRLLHRTLSSVPDAPPFVDHLRDQLATLRRRLLRHVDRQFSDPDTDIASLVDNMCAFSLATSSTPTDVLRHFHHVRVKSISRQLSRGRQAPKRHILQALQLYVRTLQDTQAVFPKKLADALSTLKSHPLLKDREVRGLVEMNLEIHEGYIAENVRNFTPWPRHDELSRGEAELSLKAWAKHALSALISGMKNLLSAQDDLKDVVDVRKEMLETWLSSSGRVPGLNPAVVLDELRDALTAQLGHILRARAQSLDDVLTEIERVLQSWRADDVRSAPSLWDPSTISLEVGDGAVAFRQAILARTHGRTASLDQVLARYDAWAASVSAAHATIKAMRDVRWDEYDLGSDPDSDDTDGAEPGSLQNLLGEDDTHALSTVLADALAAAYEAMRARLDALIAALPAAESASAAVQAIFVLRALREITRRMSSLPVASSASSSSAPSQSPIIPPSILTPIHRRLAVAVAGPALDRYKTAQRRLMRRERAVARELWDGAPPLPTQASPAPFKLLRTLVLEMARLGADLWGKTAVEAVKAEVRREVGRVLDGDLEQIAGESQHVTEAGEEKSETDGDIDEGVKGADDGDSDAAEATSPLSKEKSEGVQAQKMAARKEKLTQVLFDVSYLHRALAADSPSQGDESDDQLDAARQALVKEADIQGADLERLIKSAADYWKRTYLLFALLA